MHQFSTFHTVENSNFFIEYKLLITLLITVLISVLIYYCIQYFSNNQFSMSNINLFNYFLKKRNNFHFISTTSTTTIHHYNQSTSFHSSSSSIISSTLSNTCELSYINTSYMKYGYQTLEWYPYCQQYDAIAHFNIITFNLLAPCYKRLNIVNKSTHHRERESSYPEKWNDRLQKTLEFLKTVVFPSTSIVAFQEYWLYPEYSAIFQAVLMEYGYELLTLQRTGDKMDAVALAIKKEIFTVMKKEDISLCSHGDRVALLLWLRHNTTNKDILIANTHANERIDQMRQMRKLTTVMEDFASENYISYATRIVTGDFNVVDDSPVCDHLRDAGFHSSLELSPPINIDSSTVKSTLRANNSYLAMSISNGQKQKSTVRFVSHRTHRVEDLGVDHIFIRPEFEFIISPEMKGKIGQLDGLQFMNSPRNMSQTVNKITSTLPTVKYYPNNSCIYHQSIIRVPSDQDLHAESTFSSTSIVAKCATRLTQALFSFSDEDLELLKAKGIAQDSIKCVGSVFVEGTEVIPHKIPCHHWVTEFDISDHRPVGACLVIARDKSVLASSHSSNDSFPDLHDNSFD